MKRKRLKKGQTRAAVKEVFDRLPGGIAYFDKKGVPVLVNLRMYALCHELMGRDLQNLTELDGCVDYSKTVMLADRTVWKFQKNDIRTEKDAYTEIIASDVTQLDERRAELERKKEEQEELMEHLKGITSNVVSITRNEEILAMKMKIHNELGYSIGATKRFLEAGCPLQAKEDYAREQIKMAKKLLGEVGNTDEADVFEELKASAEKLGMEIIIRGKIPVQSGLRTIFTNILRECLTNTVRHAGGDKVFVVIEKQENGILCSVKNNGVVPTKDVAEGGGITAIRRQIEDIGGRLQIETKPEFVLIAMLPEQEKKERGKDK